MYMYIIRLCIRYILEAQMRTYAADMRPTRKGRNQASSSTAARQPEQAQPSSGGSSSLLAAM